MPSTNAYAIFAVDPGGTTGCACAVINAAQPTVASVMRRARRKGLLWSWDLTGSHFDQSWVICRRATDFFYKYHVEKQFIRANRSLFVSESFELRQMAVDLDPVRILAGIETLMYGAGFLSDSDDYFMTQTASQAFGFCSDDMLKKWGLWAHRSPHQRSAIKHLAARVDRLLG